jgi:mutual gliding-motility protein MglA
MVQINFAQKSVTVKIVYYGPGMSGKTTNLEVVHQKAPENSRGELTSISTDGDRTLFFDFMPLDLGTVAGMRTQFQIYTVPGQVYYNSTRKLVLQGVDGVIFIADSSASMMEENLESLRNLQENLQEYGKDIMTIPMVMQFNKRDLPDAMSMPELEAAMNPMGCPTFEGIANTGQGVFPTLKALAATVLDTIHEQTGGGATPPTDPQVAPASEVPTPTPMQQTGFHPTPAATQPSPVTPPMAEPVAQEPQFAAPVPPEPQFAEPVAPEPQFAEPVAPEPQPVAEQVPMASPPQPEPAAPLSMGTAEPMPMTPMAGSPEVQQTGFHQQPMQQTGFHQPVQPMQQTGFHQQPATQQPAAQPTQQPAAQPLQQTGFQPQPTMQQTGFHQPMAQPMQQTGFHQAPQQPAQMPNAAQQPAQPQAGQPQLGMGTPGSFPRPAGADSLAQTHVHAPPSMGPVPNGTAEANSSLRMAGTAIAPAPTGAPAPASMNVAQESAPHLMQVTEGAKSGTHAVPAQAPTGRIRPRTTSTVATPKASGARSAMISIVCVVAALGAGVAIGGMVFGIF